MDRGAGELGYCGAGPIPRVAAILAHFGEEPPLCGTGGAGTIFLARCNMRCVYCQNHQISQSSTGSIMRPVGLAAGMLQIQRKGCANVALVSPGPHLPGLLEAVAIAVEYGLELPIVYNTNGYESLEVLELLNGIVDVYLPDLKYAASVYAAQYSDTPDYVERARQAILKMHKHVGNLVTDLHGRAVRGLIIRHLVLPGGISGVPQTLCWIRDNLPRTITLSLMAQYSPLHRSSEFPPLHRRLTPEEYEAAVDLAWEMGFENVFIQDIESQDSGIPDFALDQPFDWS